METNAKRVELNACIKSFENLTNSNEQIMSILCEDDTKAFQSFVQNSRNWF
jgi:hypothetical protein